MNFAKGTTTDNYKKIELGSYSNLLVFCDTANEELEFSVDGSATAGIVGTSETGIEFRDAFVSTIYVKSAAAGTPVNYRIFAYGKGLREQITNENSDKTKVPKNVPTDFDYMKVPPLNNNWSADL